MSDAGAKDAGGEACHELVAVEIRQQTPQTNPAGFPFNAEDKHKFSGNMEAWRDPDKAVLFSVVRTVVPPLQPRYFKVRARGAV